MSESFYERLSFFDSTYLAMERPNSYMHIAAILTFEAGPLARPDGGVDIDRIRAFIGSKLSLIPRYRQRLDRVPVDGVPVWVDDAHFSLDYHVRHTALPRPGTDAELKRLAARVFAQHLDRSRPLWEIWVIEGLDLDRFAMVIKVHHSMIDGMAGVDILQAIMSLYPTDDVAEAEPWEPRPVPSSTRLLVDEAARIARVPLDLARNAAGLLSNRAGAQAELRHRAEAVVNAVRTGWFNRTGTTPVNETLSPHRRFEWLTVDLDRVKDVKNALGGTVNDVVLAVVAGAVRAFLGERGVDLDSLEYRVMVPVSVRPDDEQNRMGNQVAMWLVDMPIAEPDPVKRLSAIRATVEDLKMSDAALGATILTQAASWMPLNLLSLGVRLVYAAARPFNMTVTNVPGPQIPIYLLGSKLLANYPMVPLYMDHGIGVALFSYDGDIDWGLVADYDLVPDLDRFAAAISSSLDDLWKAASRVARAQKRKAARRAAAGGA